MKTLFILWMLLALCLAAASSFAQCSFSFQTAAQQQATNFYCNISGSGTAHWDFGDGDTSNLARPSHAYANPGTYSVCLTLVDTICSGTTCQNVVVAPCQSLSGGVTPSFTVVNMPFQTYCTNTSSSPNLPIASTWNFYGSFNSIVDTGNSVTVALHQGYVDISLYVTDSAGCNNSIDTTIYVLGNYPCNAEFDYLHLDLGTDSFIASPYNINTSVFNWNFGDGGTSSTADNSHVYATNGNYNVCLMVTNSTAGCADTFCRSIFIQACPTFASFIDTLSGPMADTIHFYSTSTTQSGPLTYNWSFMANGQTSISSLANPVIEYSSTGSVNVSLTVTDANGCSAVSQTIAVGYGLQPGVIWGSIDTAGACPYVVYLIQEDFPGHLVLIDSVMPNDTIYPGQSTLTCGNTFGFSIAVPGKYYLKVAEQPSSPDYLTGLPTYFDNALHWANATVIYVPANGSLYINLFVLTGINAGGPGFIAGYVSQGAGLSANNEGNADAKSLGGPAAGVQVDLTTFAGQPVAYTFTDANGHYKFNNLAYGTYTIFTDILNDARPSVNVTLSPSMPADTTANDTVPQGLTGIASVNNISINSAYPDPVFYDVHIDISSHTETSAVLKLVDITGRLLLEKPVKLFNGLNHFDVDINDLASGIYQLVFQTNNQSITHKLVKVN